MTFYQWVTIGAIGAGFMGTWLIGAFTLGRAVEQMKTSFKEAIDAERDKIIERVEALEEKFLSDQRTQDHNFGEVGAAMRQYIADVEKKVREVEIYGRDNYVKIPDFEKAIDRISETMAAGFAEIKSDIRGLLKKPQ
jgi:hypothetical protein